MVDPLIHSFVDECMGQASQSLDFEVFRFGERPLAEIEGSLRQVGMFSAERCIWLRAFLEAKKRTAAKTDEDSTDGDASDSDDDDTTDASAVLLALLEHGVPAGVTLVVSAASLDARSRLFKWFAKNGRVEDRRVQLDKQGKLSEGGLRGAIEQRLAELGVSRIGPGVVEEIVKRSGNVLGETLQEVDRLVLAQSDPSLLAVANVRSGMRDLSLGWVFDFTKALEARDLAAAESLVTLLLAQGEPPLRLVGLIASQVGQMVAARPLVDTLPRGALRMNGPAFFNGPGASLPDAFRGWPGYFRLRAAANFSATELERLHHEVLRLDLALKSSPLQPALLISRMLQSACISAAKR